MFKWEQFCTRRSCHKPEVTYYDICSPYFIEKTLEYIESNENKKLKRLEIQETVHRFEFIEKIIKSAPLVKEIKLCIREPKINDKYFFDLKKLTNSLINLKELRLCFSFEFLSPSIYGYFIGAFKDILIEFIVDLCRNVCCTSYFFQGLSKLTKVRTLTIMNAQGKITWMSKLQKAMPNLRVLKFIRIDDRNTDIHEILKLWPNIKYVFISDNQPSIHYDLGSFKPYLRSISKQAQISSPLTRIWHWSGEFIYSRDFKTIFTTRADYFGGRLPSNIEHLYFIKASGLRFFPGHTHNFKEMVRNSPQLRSLRTNPVDMESFFPIFMDKSLHEPNKQFLLGDLESDWMYKRRNISSNSHQMMDWFKYGPLREDNLF